MNIIKSIVSRLFDPSVPEALLKVWVMSSLAVLAKVRAPATTAIATMKLGLAMHRAYNFYYATWLCHYLELGRPWAETLSLIRKNSFCPEGIEKTYRGVRFDNTAEENAELFKVLPRSKRLQAAYARLQA